MEGWTGGCMDGWLDRWLQGWIDKGMNRCMDDERMDGRDAGYGWGSDREGSA